ncbi:hypothetical protein TcCL_Unassigned01241 [Trypanosoma cruzi]|nr:hypothetical protein TcCL_Unassigned01241 [Trypanosoma cruzi]
MGRKIPPHNACTRAHAEAPPATSHRNEGPWAQHTHGRNKRDVTHPSTRRSPLLLASPTDRHHASQQAVAVASHTHSEARRTPSAPPSALSRPAPSHPRALAMGNTNNRRRGPSVPLAEKKLEEMEAFRKHSQQRDNKRDTETHNDSEHGTDGKRCNDLPKRTKKKNIKTKKRKKSDLARVSFRFLWSTIRPCF